MENLSIKYPLKQRKIIVRALMVYCTELMKDDLKNDSISHHEEILEIEKMVKELLPDLINNLN